MRTLKWIAILAGLLIAAGVLVHALHPLPSLAGRSVSSAYTDTQATRLGRSSAAAVTAHPGASGIYPLRDPLEAFAARMLLAEAAERSLDIQYYIWRVDRTGTLLLDALQRAANRGVRVRLLLDDNNTAGLDPLLAALDSHDSIEVRLFNPFVIRRPRAIGFLTDFSRLNRRMHNKSFTADNQVTVIGGRNVGDEYFGAAAAGAVAFTDLDVLAIGPAVRDVSTDFDRYWSSGSAYPAERVLPPPSAAALREIERTVHAVRADDGTAAYVSATRESGIVDSLIAGTLRFEWARVRMVSDDPAKGLGRAPREGLLWEQLGEIIGAPMRDLDLVTPYFVPTKAGVDAFVRLAARGARVRVLSNSLEATDVDAVHSGYAKHRKALLEGGIALYETRLASGEDRRRVLGPFGSSGSSLHAKTFAVDRARIFIGSFNFDPRSANLNTELGFVIESASLAEQVAEYFDERVPTAAYEVHLEDGEIFWTERVEGATVRHDTEPGTHALQRFFVWFLALLPIDFLL